MYQKANDLLSNGAIQSSKLQVGNRQAHYLTAGGGSPVVLLHGGADDSRTWAETMAALSHSYTMYAPDMLGYGLSEKNKEGYYLSEFVDFICDFIQALDLQSTALVGHSLGGRVCLEVALRHPYLIRRLVLIDTVGFGKLAWWGTFLGAAAWSVRAALGKPQPYPRFLWEGKEDKDWRCLEKLSNLKVPTLVVWNRLDPYYSVRYAFKAKELMPEAHLAIFPGYGHAPHVRKRDDFNNLLLNFLNHNQP